MNDSVSITVRWATLTLMLVVPIVILTLLVSLTGDTTLIQRLTTALILMVAVVALQTFSGNSGVISFSTVAFVMIAAYTSALLTIPAEQKPSLFPDMPWFLAWVIDISLPVPLGILVAIVFTGFVGFLVGIPLVRLSGLAAGIATLALLVVTTVIITKWKAVTRGESTMVGVPKETTLWWALIAIVIAIAIAALFQVSRRGRRLIATREDANAARSIGISVPIERLWGWTISVSLAALAGALYGHYIGTFSAVSFGFSLTFFIVAMLVIGGMNSLSGAVVGVIVVQVLSEFMRTIETKGLGPIPAIDAPGLTEMVLALIMLFVLIARPDGITGGKEITAFLRSRKKVNPARETASVEVS